MRNVDAAGAQMDTSFTTVASITAKTFGMDNSEAKSKWVGAWILAIWAKVLEFLLRPVGGVEAFATPVFALVVVLVCADWLTGIWRTMTRKNKSTCTPCDLNIKCGPKDKRYNKLSSSVMINGLIKICVYFVIVYMGLALARVGEGHALGFITSLGGDVLIALVCITEVLSLLENMSCITTSVGINIPLLGTLLKYFKKKQDDVLKKDVNTSTDSQP